MTNAADKVSEYWAADQGAGRPRVTVCPVCLGTRFNARFRANELPIEGCGTCGLVLQNPQPSDGELAMIYGPNYFIGSADDPALAAQVQVVKRGTARLQLDEIDAYLARAGRSSKGLRVLEVGCGHGNMLLEVRARGYEVHGLEYSPDAAAIANRKLGNGTVRIGSPSDAAFARGSFDICILADVIEHLRDPRRALFNIRQMLDHRGIIAIATPSLSSWSARLLGRRWMEFKPEHLFYFEPSTLTKLLTDLDFRDIRINSGKKILTTEYIIGHFDKFPVPLITPTLRLARRILPRRMLKMKMKVTASGINLCAIRP